MVKVGINGFGSVGRAFVRKVHKEIDGGQDPSLVQIVAYNDLGTPEIMAGLLKHDSDYGTFDGTVEVDGDNIVVNGQRIRGYSEIDPSKIPWKDAGVDLVVESTGRFADADRASSHLGAGARYVIITAPSKDAGVTIVPGVNDDMYKGQKIISASTFATQSLAPLTQVLHNTFGIECGMVLLESPYTGDQQLLDSIHSDIARAYAAAENLIPTAMGSPKSILNVIPGLEGKLEGRCHRIPLSVGFVLNMVYMLSREASQSDVNNALIEAADRHGNFGYMKGPIVTNMVKGQSLTSIVDLSGTIKIGGLLHIEAHGDNRVGYAHQLSRLVQLVGQYASPTTPNR